MINYRYNETKYAELLIKKGFITKYRVYELKILAKYYKEQGKKPRERKQLIYDFCEKYIEGFNPVLYFKTINSVLSYSSKKESRLIDVESVVISSRELRYIDSADLSLNEKKILFGLLVMNKINKKISMIMYDVESKNNKFGGSTSQFRELFKSSKITGKQKVSEIIHSLYTKGHIHINSFYKNDIGKIQLHFIDEIDNIDEYSFDSDDEDIIVNTFDNIGYYYDKHIGDEKIIECEECKALIKMSSNRKKFCSECWKMKEKDNNRRYSRESMRKKRNVKGLENTEKTL